jgi:hypothetical protein
VWLGEERTSRETDIVPGTDIAKDQSIRSHSSVAASFAIDRKDSAAGVMKFWLQNDAKQRDRPRLSFRSESLDPIEGMFL